jgi:hypothetical protein
MDPLVSRLAHLMVQRKRTGAEPYVLLLGAGTSIASGLPSYAVLAERFLRRFASDHWRSVETLPESGRAAAAINAFHEVWRSIGLANRRAFLMEQLSGEPSSGHADLAALVRCGCLRVILSTNLDTLVEQAFQQAGLVPDRDYEIIVNGRGLAAHVARRLGDSTPPVKLVKLHGTLKDPDSYAWLPEECFEFEAELEDVLVDVINRDLLVLGNRVDDRDLDLSLKANGGEIWYVNPRPPDGGSRFGLVVTTRGRGQIVSDDAALFDGFLRNLRTEVEAAEACAATGHDDPAIFRFLRALGFQDEMHNPRSRYVHLPELFARPSEYDEARRLLEEQRCLVLIGEPHMGKTYTALHLLWEDFNQGRSVTHLLHGGLREELRRCRHQVAEFAARHLPPGATLHLDDPFGETQYESGVGLEKSFRDLLHAARSRPDTRLIVTTRLQVFNEALGYAEGADRFVGDMGLRRDIRVFASYTPDQLADLVERYARLYETPWARDAELLERMRAEVPRLLEAPHNIELFVRTSEGLSAAEDLLAHARASRELVTALRDWIIRLPLEDQLFLMTIAWIPSSDAQPFGRDGVERYYVGLLGRAYARGLRLRAEPGAWSAACRRSADVVRPVQAWWGPTMGFVHPSYLEATREAACGRAEAAARALLEDAVGADPLWVRLSAIGALASLSSRAPTWTVPLLARLAEDPAARGSLAAALGRNY